jgi:hypothetical protein
MKGLFFQGKVLNIIPPVVLFADGSGVLLNENIFFPAHVSEYSFFGVRVPDQNPL